MSPEPKFNPGRRNLGNVLQISAEATAKLRPAAHRRGLDVRNLAALMIETIARDGLVSAILDDGEMSNG